MFHSCETTEAVENKLPCCTITVPKQAEEIERGITVPITVNVDDTDGYITMVDYLINDVEVSCGNSNSLQHYWNTASEDTGVYVIRVSVIDNEGGSSIDEKSVHLIEAFKAQEPEAAFTSSHNFICPKTTMQFTDLSANKPSEWLWDFGDDSISKLQNPTHEYSSLGCYTVSLTVSNNHGSDTETKTDFVHVTSTGAETGTVSDYDGNTYETVKIGSQWWMNENLRTTHYATGAEIPLVENNTEWAGQSIEIKAMCNYNNSSLNGNTYGALYTWAAATNGSQGSSSNPSGVIGVCPSGWHLPSDDEWKQLEIFLGMSPMAANGIGFRGTNEGSKLAGNSNLWKEGELKDDPSFGTTGFDVYPGGGRNNFGHFQNLGNHGAMWTSTRYDSGSVWGRCVYNDHTEIRRYNCQKDFAFSVRCVKN